MKKIFLYEGRNKKRHQTDLFVMVDDSDFDELNKYEWGLMKIYHTKNKIYYARRYKTINGKFTAILMHRVILNLSSKEDKADHKDGNGLNNQQSNLRKSTHAQNMSNRKQQDNSSSIYIGVQKYTSSKGEIRYRYSIQHNKINYQKQGFISEDVAANERDKIALQLKGEFAALNTIRWY